MKNLKTVLSIKHLGGGPMETLNPFLFCVYHKDNYPSGDKSGSMALPESYKSGNGMDFNPNAEYRMYHGKRVPGFPQHPHRGFETLTATLEGVIDHTDSLGNAGRYGNGDLQWMTAGSGVVHGENFPLLNTNKPNPLKLFQIWLNLPKKDKMVKPDFVMHWAEDIQSVENSENNYKVTVFAGEFEGKKGLEPTKHSWARDPRNEVAVFFIDLNEQAEMVIPKAKYGSEVNRAVYIVEGDGAIIAGKDVVRQSKVFPTMIEVSAADDLSIKSLPDQKGKVGLLLLQGRPINEPVVQQGPFVMNSQEEIRQTYAEYRKTEFGGWPWDEDTVVFPKDKPRFAKINGKEYFPPSALSTSS